MQVKIRGGGKTVRVVFKISLQSLLYKKGGGEQSSASFPSWSADISLKDDVTVPTFSSAVFPSWFNVFRFQFRVHANPSFSFYKWIYILENHCNPPGLSTVFVLRIRGFWSATNKRVKKWETLTKLQTKMLGKMSFMWKVPFFLPCSLCSQEKLQVQLQWGEHWGARQQQQSPAPVHRAVQRGLHPRHPRPHGGRRRQGPKRRPRIASLPAARGPRKKFHRQKFLINQKFVYKC